MQVSEAAGWSREKPFKDKEQGLKKDTEAGLLVCGTWTHPRFITHGTDIRDSR